MNKHVTLKSFKEIAVHFKPDQHVAAAKNLNLPADSIELILVDPASLIGDESYQRHPRKRIGLINDIAKNFDINAFGFPHIRIRPDGTKVIIDGWGRIWAKYVILKQKQPIVCINHKHIKTVEQESEWFVILNLRTKKVNKTEIFKAEVASGDKDALHLVKTAAKGGANVNSAGASGISAQAAHYLDHLGILEETAQIKQAAWPKEKAGNPVWIALGAILYSVPKLDKMRLIHVLKELHPKQLEIKSELKYGTSSHARIRSNRLAAYIGLLYNYRRAESEKIHPSWMRINQVSEGRPHLDRWAKCQLELGNDKP